MHKPFWRWLGVVGILGLPTPALAHSPVPGIEGFYLGLLHPLSTPAQVLLFIGLAVLIGGHDKTHARWMLLAFLVATGTGMLAGGGIEIPDPVLYATAALASTLAALSVRRLFPAALVCVAFAGLLIGVISIPDAGAVRGRTITMLGSFLGSNVFLLYLAGMVIVVTDRFDWKWVPIAFRVVAAWVAAISAIMLAFHIAPESSGVAA